MLYEYLVSLIEMMLLHIDYAIIIFYIVIYCSSNLVNYNINLNIFSVNNVYNLTKNVTLKKLMKRKKGKNPKYLLNIVKKCLNF